MELKNFKPKKGRDLLAETIEEFLNSPTEQSLFFLISQKLRGGKGKTYKNFDGELPSGNYQELEVNGPEDSRRIIIDMNHFDTYATRDHYKTITYSGRPYNF